MSFTDQRNGRHYLPWRAIAALERVVIDEGLLNRMELSVRGEAFNRRDLRAIRRGGEDKATIHASTIQMDRAGAAFTEVAALLGPCQV